LSKEKHGADRDARRNVVLAYRLVLSITLKKAPWGPKTPSPRQPPSTDALSSSWGQQHPAWGRNSEYFAHVQLAHLGNVLFRTLLEYFHHIFSTFLLAFFSATPLETS